MTVDSAFRDRLLALFAPLGEVRFRAMFGGGALYLEGTVFALIAGDTLFLKADDVNRPDFEAAGARPFQPFDDRPYTMSYWRVPATVMADADTLHAWALAARDASLRTPPSRRRGRGRAGQGERERPRKGRRP